MSSALKAAPILLEVLAYTPTDFLHCLHCERMFDMAGIGASVHHELQTGYPPEMLEEAERPVDWLQRLSVRYEGRLHIRIIDPQSLQGFLKSLCHWVRRYPAFIVNRRAKVTGWDSAALERLLADQPS